MDISPQLLDGRAGPLLLTIAVVGLVVMGLVDILKDLFVRQVFYVAQLGDLFSGDAHRRGLYRLRVSQLVGQLGALAQRAVDMIVTLPPPVQTAGTAAAPTPPPVEAGQGQAGAPTTAIEDRVLRRLLEQAWYDYFLKEVRGGKGRSHEGAGDLLPAQREEFQRYTDARTAVLARLQTALDTLQMQLLWTWRLTARAVAVVLGMVFSALVIPYAVGFSSWSMLLALLQAIVVCLTGGIASAIVAGIYHDVLATVRSMRRES